MQTAIRMTTKVQSGGKLELTVPQLNAEEMVEVIVLFPSDDQPLTRRPKRSVMDILTEATGHRLFQTAADVERYLQQEHETWGI